MKKFLLGIVLFGVFACKQNNCSDIACPAINIAGPYLEFSFSDEATSEDLFFSSSPQYQFQDLAVFRKKNNVDTIRVPVLIDSLNVPKHFTVVATANPDTIFIQIQNQKPDTFHITSTPVFSGCCPSGYIFSSLNLNGKLICYNCSSFIIDLKK